ncbi:MAG: metallophosphoesterase, partial [Oscillospiraceae bacterium]|nr:metallophosphoesterase [Oscillospiraceae bacterium]
MALFVIGDTHLSLGEEDKPMDVFNGWEGYLPKLERNWRTLIKPEDTVLLAGDISWAMSLEDTKADFAFLQSLPGQKYIIKGNHDYWWTTLNKMNRFLEENGFDTLHILHNSSVEVDGVSLCGTRGWLNEVQQPEDEKILNREV